MSRTKSDIEKAYHRRFSADLGYRNEVWRILVRDFFSTFINQSDHILDLGCGYGHFINHVECAHRYAMDLNPSSRHALMEGVVLFEQDCSQRWPLNPDSLDLVFTSNFFEHLPQKTDLMTTLEEAYRCLRAGGRLIAMGPNVKYLPGAYWDFFDHHIPLTDLSLQEALEIVGFESLRVTARFLPYTMVNAPRYPLSLVSLYLKMPWLWRWLGRQFLLVAKKP